MEPPVSYEIQWTHNSKKENFKEERKLKIEIFVPAKLETTIKIE